MTDLNAIKKQVSVSLFISNLGGEYSRSTRNGWDQYHCPFTGHKDGDRHASGAVSPDDRYYRCRACDARGDIFDLVKLAGYAEDLQGAIRWLEDNMLTQDTSTTDSW